MPWVEAVVSIRRNGERLPPGSAFEIGEHELAGLKGFVIETSVPAAIDSVEAPEMVALDDATPDPDSPPASGSGVASNSRAEEIMSAIDLLDPDDFTSAGRPKVAPLAAVLGFRPSVGEIEAAMALRESML